MSVELSLNCSVMSPDTTLLLKAQEQFSRLLMGFALEGATVSLTLITLENEDE